MQKSAPYAPHAHILITIMLYEDPFQEFLRSWLQQLSTALFDADADAASASERLALAARAVELHDRFFAAKRELARRDPALALSLPWLSPLSRALLWLGGWRPCAAYRMAETWAGVSAEAMRRETKAEEAAVERDMGRVQLGLLRMVVVAVAGGDEGEGGGEESVMAAMERVAVAADAVRREALRRAVASLPPSQVLGFLANLLRMEMGFYAMEQDYGNM